jgi:hypothetical protein
MSGNIFYRLDPLLICLVLIGVLVVASEIGFWVKKGMVKGGSDSIEKADIALILGAVLTIDNLSRDKEKKSERKRVCTEWPEFHLLARWPPAGAAPGGLEYRKSLAFG